MYRVLIFIGLLLMSAAACGVESHTGAKNPDGPAAAFWSAAPHTDAERAELLRRARGVDVCALIPRDKLGRFGTVRSVGNTDPSSCTGKMGSAESYRGTEIRWTALISEPLSPAAKGTRTTRGDIAYSDVADREGLAADQFGQLAERSCSASARFPSGLTLMMSVEAPLGTEPCPIADQLLPGAVRQWKTEPRQGVSPDTAHTVLLGTDPCAVATHLGVTVDFTHSRIWSCEFTYHDRDISLDYSYQQEKFFTIYNSAIPDGSHTIYRSNPSEPDDGLRLYDSPVGPVISTGSEPDFMGSYLPKVGVVTNSDEVAEDVMRQTLALFP